MAVEQAGKGLSVSIRGRKGKVFVACCHTHHGDWTDADGQSLATREIILTFGSNMRLECRVKRVAI